MQQAINKHAVFCFSALSLIFLVLIIFLCGYVKFSILYKADDLQVTV
jgi:hypothetical protein